MGAIFEGLNDWDYLARPTKHTPGTAVAMPEVTDGGRTWTVHLKPGIYCTDEPAFKGKPCELVAEDYVYSFKRWLDPNLKRGRAELTTDLIIDARAAVDAAKRPGAKFNCDRPRTGLKAVDR